MTCMRYPKVKCEMYELFIFWDFFNEFKDFKFLNIDSKIFKFFGFKLMAVIQRFILLRN